MDIQDIIKEENLVYRSSKLITDKVFNFCPGCGHGTALRLVAEVIEEMGIADETIGIGSVGCSVLVYEFLDMDMIGAAHGRAGAVATGVKRVLPELPQAKRVRLIAEYGLKPFEAAMLTQSREFVEFYERLVEA